MLVPQLQNILATFIIAYEDIIEVLNPEEDWDNDQSHLFNVRLSSVEWKDFQKQLFSGTKSFRQIKEEIRSPITIACLVSVRLWTTVGFGNRQPFAGCLLQ